MFLNKTYSCNHLVIEFVRYSDALCMDCDMDVFVVMLQVFHHALDSFILEFFLIISLYVLIKLTHLNFVFVLSACTYFIVWCNAVLLL